MNDRGDTVYGCFHGYFTGCTSLTTLHLGRDLKTGSNIDGSPFAENSALKFVTIENKVKTINNNSFCNCTGLTQITSNPTIPPAIYNNTFYGVNKDIPVKVPCSSICDYKAAQYWSSFTNYQSIDNPCTSPCLTDIEDITVQKFQIHPNPTKDEIFIKSELQIKKIEIYSLTGTLLLSENNFSGKISISALPQGVYMVKIYTDNGLVIEKVVKE